MCDVISKFDVISDLVLLLININMASAVHIVRFLILLIQSWQFLCFPTCLVRISRHKMIESRDNCNLFK